MRAILALLIVHSLGTADAAAQGVNLTKYFNKYNDVALNIDIYASRAVDVAPFERPVKAAQQKLASLLGNGLSKGVIVICSTLEQRDAVNESRVLKLGYKWVVIQMTPEATAQQMIAQVKAQMGGQVPPGMLDRIQNRSPEQKAAAAARIASSAVLRMCYAILMTTLAPEREFRSSRLEDLSRSPLADWLDVGVASYASGDAALNMSFLQEHLDEAFPLEDLLSMSRPFVAPTDTASMGGGQFVVRMGGEGGSGGGPPAGGAGATEGGGRPGGLMMGEGRGMRGGGGFNMPKDVQDRMTFDCQAASFFNFMLKVLGIDRTREVVQWNREGRLAREALVRPDYLGTDLDQIEKNWQDWVKTQKGEGPGNFQRTNQGPPGVPSPPSKP